MKFKASGNVSGFKMGGLGNYNYSILEAVMHEGWLGSNHKIQLKLDKKFTEHIAEELGFGATQWKGQYDNAVRHGPKELKILRHHRITIIIE